MARLELGRLGVGAGCRRPEEGDDRALAGPELGVEPGGDVRRLGVGVEPAARADRTDDAWLASTVLASARTTAMMATGRRKR